LRDPPARRVNARVAGDPGELHALAEGIDKLWVTADHDCVHAYHRRVSANSDRVYDGGNYQDAGCEH
jgi:hypothetical protein